MGRERDCKVKRKRYSQKFQRMAVERMRNSEEVAAGVAGGDLQRVRRLGDVSRLSSRERPEALLRARPRFSNLFHRETGC